MSDPAGVVAGGKLLATAPDLSSSTGPSHARIEQWLAERVTTGALVPGDRLPTEKELAAALGVSRMTLRQALGSLEARGVVVRVPGRQGGTFIAEPTIDVDITGLAGFTEQLRRGQVRASARVVRAGVVPVLPAVAAALGLARRDEVYEIVRVRRGHGRPLALEHSYLPAGLFPGLLDRRLSGSLYARMRRDYGLAPHAATEYLEPYIADDEPADLLDVPVGSALLLIERTASTVAGQPVEFARDLFRPDRIRISVRTGVDR